MNLRVTSGTDAITLLYAAQRHAGSFGGEELRAAAEYAARLSCQNGWRLLAADASGERIVGTATIVGNCHVADTTRRQDGASILLVAGAIAGQYGLARAAFLARSMGASEVHCAYIGGWKGDIPGCDSVRIITRDQPTGQIQPANSDQVLRTLLHPA
jgi:hypothetical protein